MSCLEKINILKRLHAKIKRQEKGSIDEFAERLNISRKCFYGYISDLENMGAVVKYSRQTKCFKYLNEFDFKLEVVFSELEDDEIKRIYGGTQNNNMFFSSVSFFTRKENNFGYVSIIGQAM